MCCPFDLGIVFGHSLGLGKKYHFMYTIQAPILLFTFTYTSHNILYGQSEKKSTKQLTN